MPPKCLAQVTSINNNFLFTLTVLLLNKSGFFKINSMKQIISQDSVREKETTEGITSRKIFNT